MPTCCRIWGRWLETVPEAEGASPALLCACKGRVKASNSRFMPVILRPDFDRTIFRGASHVNAFTRLFHEKPWEGATTRRRRPRHLRRSFAQKKRFRMTDFKTGVPP